MTFQGANLFNFGGGNMQMIYHIKKKIYTYICMYLIWIYNIYIYIYNKHDVISNTRPHFPSLSIGRSTDSFTIRSPCHTRHPSFPASRHGLACQMARRWMRNALGDGFCQMVRALGDGNCYIYINIYVYVYNYI